jgi:chromosome segregation ATPase|eukprot:TRINITY_DN85_c1_g2_i1.p4 TRINITY_DN85_c1_g2~~TRINITY_DN85_c1_g2_i1.p4  ORF type:complete len:284 (-),score=103.07 TRINITY_DN85_c1_g2_i1:137-988(-)
MTTVGKILVVLHLVLSIMFMAFAGAVFTAQKNWRTNALAAQASLTKANTKLKDQLAEFERERTDTTANTSKLNDQIMKLTAEKGTLTTQVLALTTDNERLQLANDQVEGQAQLQTVEASERTAESTLQRNQNATTYQWREQLNKKVHELEDTVFAKDQELQLLNDRHERVLKDLQTIKIWLGRKRLPTDPKLMIAETTPPPPLEGRVVDYVKEKKGNTELVEVSLGSDDGLSVGHTMTVYNRDGRYLGQIRLTLVNADKAVGIVTLKEKNTVIQKGDNVTTKL